MANNTENITKILIRKDILDQKDRIIKNYFKGNIMPDTVTTYAAAGVIVYDYSKSNRSNLAGAEDEYYKAIYLNESTQRENK